MVKYHELEDGWLLKTEVWNHYENGKTYFQYKLSKDSNYPSFEYSYTRVTHPTLYVRKGFNAPRIEVDITYREARFIVLQYLLNVKT